MAEEIVFRAEAEADPPPETGEFIAHGLASFVECPLPVNARPAPPAPRVDGD